MGRKDAAGESRGSVSYHRLSRNHDEYSDLQFKHPAPKIPWKAITLASGLFLFGTIMIVLGALIMSGTIDSKYSDRMWPLLVLGCLMFIPGAYHVRIAYYAYRGFTGFSFEDIPNFD